MVCALCACGDAAAAPGKRPSLEVVATSPDTESTQGSPSVNLIVMDSLGELSQRFDQDRGTLRLVLLLSPTSVTCQAGAREVQSILAAFPDRKLKVYAIWFKMLSDDARESWQPILTDDRVVNLWDDGRNAGLYYANGRGYQGGAIYDYYFLYRPDAGWQGKPSGWESSGTTVVDYADQLRKAISSLQ